MNLQATGSQNTRYLPFNSIVQGGCCQQTLPNNFRPQLPSGSTMTMPQQNSGVMAAIQELAFLVKELIARVIGGGNTPPVFQSGQQTAVLRQMPGQARARASAAPSQTKGIRGLMHKGADWLVNKGYDWLNKKMEGSLDSLNSISTNTFGKIWDGAGKIGSVLLDKVSGIGSSIANGLSSIGSSIVSGVSSLFGF